MRVGSMDLDGRNGTVAVAEDARHVQHDGQRHLTAVVVADAQRFALLGKTRDVLIGEGQLAAEEQNLPRPLHPDKEQRQGGEAAVDGIVGGHVALQPDVPPLEGEEERAGDDARHDGAAQPHARIGHHDIDEREHRPDDQQRDGARQQRVERTEGVDPQQMTGIAPRRAADDPQNRRNDHHGDVVGELPREAARDLHLPDIVEGLLDRAEDPHDGPEEHDDPDEGDDASLRGGERLVGEGDEVVDHLAVVRKERIEVLHQSVGQPEPLDHGEDERRDRNDRHERVEGQRRTAHQRVVFVEPARRIKEQLVLPHAPTDQSVAVVAFVFQKNRLRKERPEVFEKGHAIGELTLPAAPCGPRRITTIFCTGKTRSYPPKRVS